MNKFLFKYIASIVIGISLLSPIFANADDGLELYFFYSPTCPHCHAEDKFLDEIEDQYPSLIIHRKLAYNSSNQKLLRELAVKHDALDYLGSVPLTFIGEDFFLGFDNADGIGKAIEDSIKRQLVIDDNPPPPDENNQDADDKIVFPILGEVDISKYSFITLAISLGFLDGFNVCSLGALVLILGLVLALGSRKKIILFGGIFIITTAVIYGILIVLWYQLFSYLVPFIKIMEIIVGVLGLFGAAFFLRQFIRFRKYGPTCGIASGDSMISRAFRKIQRMFKNPKSIFLLIWSVFAFAVVVTVIEFPCSAAIPVIFAGILSKSQLPGLAYFFYIAVFILFYMIDEIIVFLIAVFKMDIWLSSPKFTVWATFIEAIILGLIGFYYLFGLI
ncbi:hypothetical protein ACFL3E_01095 [Patescibacteria group bacterium]